MSNLSDLQAALVAAAASIANTIDRLECLTTIDEWAAARTALADLQSKGISAYTIAGRSITRKDTHQVQLLERTLYQRIHEALYCRGSGLVDGRGDNGSTNL